MACITIVAENLLRDIMIYERVCDISRSGYVIKGCHLYTRCDISQGKLITMYVLSTLPRPQRLSDISLLLSSYI